MTESTRDPAGWLSLDAAIEAFMTDKEVSDGTLDRYGRYWARWEEFCADRGFQALGAPWEAYEEFWRACATQTYFRGRRRKASLAGQPFAQSSIDLVLAAVARKHRQAGLTAAFKQAAHAELHSELRSGYERGYAPDVVVSALPLRPGDVRALNRADPPPDDAKGRLAAGLLLSLDARWDWVRIRAANSTHVRAAGEGGLLLADPVGGGTVLLPCTCGAAAGQGALAALPNVCSACLVAPLLDATPPRASLLNPAAKGSAINKWRGALRRVTGTFQHLVVAPGGYLAYAGPDDAWARAGTRLALLEAERGGLAYRSAQARMSLSWPIGVGASNEPHRMARKHIAIRGDGSLDIELPRKPGDHGTPGQRLHLPGTPKQAGALGRVVQWLAIIDAFTGMGQEGPLFPEFDRIDGLRRPRSKASARVDFARLQEAAGTSGFTLNSTRSGFATTGVEQGLTQSDIQEAMRLKQPRSLMNYAKQARRSPGAPAEQLIRQMMEAE